MIDRYLKKLRWPVDIRLLATLVVTVVVYCFLWRWEQTLYCYAPHWLYPLVTGASDKISGYGNMLQTIVALSIFIGEAFLGRSRGRLLGATLLHATDSLKILILSILGIILTVIKPVPTFLVIQTCVVGVLLAIAFIRLINILLKQHYLYEKIEDYLLALFAANSKDFKKNVEVFIEPSKYFDINGSTHYLGKSLPDYVVTNKAGYITGLYESNINALVFELHEFLRKYQDKIDVKSYLSGEKKLGYLSGYIGTRLSIAEKGEGLDSKPVPGFVMDYNLSSSINKNDVAKKEMKELLGKYNNKLFHVSKYPVQKNQITDFQLFVEHIVSEIRDDNQGAVDELIGVFRNIAYTVIDKYREIDSEGSEGFKVATPIFYEYFEWIDDFFMTVNREAYKKGNPHIILSANYLPFVIASRSRDSFNLYRRCIEYIPQLYFLMVSMKLQDEDLKHLIKSHISSNLFNNALYTGAETREDEMFFAKFEVILRQYIQLMFIALKNGDGEYLVHLFNEQKKLIRDWSSTTLNNYDDEADKKVELANECIDNNNADLFGFFTILIREGNYEAADQMGIIKAMLNHYKVFKTAELLNILNHLRNRDSLRLSWEDLDLSKERGYSPSGVRAGWSGEEISSGIVLMRLVRERIGGENFVPKFLKELGNLRYQELFQLQLLIQNIPVVDDDGEIKGYGKPFITNFISSTERTVILNELEKMVARAEEGIVTSMEVDSNKLAKFANIVTSSLQNPEDFFGLLNSPHVLSVGDTDEVSEQITFGLDKKNFVSSEELPVMPIDYFSESYKRLVDVKMLDLLKSYLHKQFKGTVEEIDEQKIENLLQKVAEDDVILCSRVFVSQLRRMGYDTKCTAFKGKYEEYTVKHTGLEPVSLIVSADATDDIYVINRNVAFTINDVSVSYDWKSRKEDLVGFAYLHLKITAHYLQPDFVKHKFVFRLRDMD